MMRGDLRFPAPEVGPRLPGMAIARKSLAASLLEGPFTMYPANADGRLPPHRYPVGWGESPTVTGEV
jgi:hypothetical protein